MRQSSTPKTVNVSNPAPRPLIDHRIRRDSGLRFDGHIYNASQTPDSKSDVVLQIQIMRDRQPVLTTPLQRVPDNHPSSALGFGGTLPLQNLPAGRYLLLITAIDRIHKQSASQQARFEIY